MPNSPYLSVVIPTCNTRELTLRCLGSLRQVHFEGERLEILLVDDGGSDGTAQAVAERFPEIVVLEGPRDTGFTRAANRGLKRARGEVLLLLNSDTEVERETLSELGRTLDEDPALGIVGAQLYYPDGSPQWSGGRTPGLIWLFVLASGLSRWLEWLPGYRRSKPLSARQPREVDWVTGAALAMRREVWEAVGPLDESFRFYAQDLDLCLRARQVGWKIEVRPSIRVLHHHGATIGGISGADAHQNPELLWTDLLRWCRIHYGESWARRARVALLGGGMLRLMARFLRALGLASDRRMAYRRQTRAYRRALEAVWGRLHHQGSVP